MVIENFVTVALAMPGLLLVKKKEEAELKVRRNCTVRG